MFVTDSGRLTGKPEVTCSRFQADSDDVVQKSLSGDRKLISSKPVSGQPVNSDRLLDTSAFVGTNPTGELITSGLPVIQPESQGQRNSSCPVKHEDRGHPADFVETGAAQVRCNTGRRGV